MKNIFTTFSILLLNLFFSCSNAQNNELKVNLSPAEFSEKISQNSAAKLLMSVHLMSLAMVIFPMH